MGVGKLSREGKGPGKEGWHMRRMVVVRAIRQKNNDTFEKIIMKSITLYANQKDHILKLCPY